MDEPNVEEMIKMYNEVNEFEIGPTLVFMRRSTAVKYYGELETDAAIAEGKLIPLEEKEYGCPV